MPSQPGSSNWQSHMAAHSATPFMQPAMSSHPGTYNWQSHIPSHMGNPNLQTPIETHPDGAGLLDHNIPNRGKGEQRPSMYRQTPYVEQPSTTVLPKQRGNKNKNKVHKATVLPLNLGNVFDDDNEGSDDIMFVGGQFTGNMLVYENVDPNKTRTGQPSGLVVRGHDVVFVGQWCEGNINTLTHVLDCFYHASGLRINMGKSKIIGTLVEKSIVSNAASKLGCLLLKLPFSYLGTKVGSSMSRINAWEDVINKKPSQQGINFMDFMCLKLGNGSSISFWNDQWIGDRHLRDLFPRLYALEDNKNAMVNVKLSDGRLESSFRREPRSGAEQAQLNELSILVSDVNLRPISDRWALSLKGSGDFSVASIRKVIDGKRFSKVSSKTRWIKSVPNKVNILAWKVKFDGLPTRLNISRRGIMIDSIIFPICDRGVESSNHMFFMCNLASNLSCMISKWWDIPHVKDLFIGVSIDVKPRLVGMIG
nr:RNA-directed DNA polymerase, eukaryota [Tanacetum cinerariifolium]